MGMHRLGDFLPIVNFDTRKYFPMPSTTEGRWLKTEGLLKTLYIILRDRKDSHNIQLRASCRNSKYILVFIFSHYFFACHQDEIFGGNEGEACRNGANFLFKA